MFTKTFTGAALALAASSLVYAQTSTDCNPLQKSCPADGAFGGQASCDFTQGACSLFSPLPGTTISYNSNGAVFKITGPNDGPTIRTGLYLFFGRVDIVLQASPGVGIVTSAVLQSDDLDEIDWEWLGGDNTQAQTNYFSKGDTTTYNRGAFHPVANPTGQFHKYSVEWNSQGVTWLIDDNVVRTLTAAEANGGATLPQTPMQVKLGTWVAGNKDTAPGTVQWAGGYTDFSKAPFIGYYKSISIVDYAGADGPGSKGAKTYSYGDHSGSYKSIKIDGSGSTHNSDPSSSSAAPSSTKAASSSTPSSSKAPATSSSSSSSSSTSTSTSSSSSGSTSSSDAGSSTTLSTAVAPATTTSGSGSGSGSNSTIPTGTGTVPTAPAKPSTIPGNAGANSAAAVGTVLIAGAGALLAQLFL